VARVIVLGHARCGGIRALLARSGRTRRPISSASGWHRRARGGSACGADLGHRSSAEQHHACELASILLSLDNLLTYPWLRRRVDEGKLKLHGWYFDLESGALMAYSPRQQQFLPLVCPLPPRDVMEV
jgi:carbonic anhydrase